jgi:hypothetical protein
VKRLVNHYRSTARVLAWIGIFAITVLSVVPANDRPVTGAGLWLFGLWFGPWFRQWFEHFTAFALVAGMFAIGYRFSLIRLLLLAFFFCGGIELLQVPLPTRHARVSDFVIDFAASCFAIAVVFVSDNLIGRNRQSA